MTEQTTSVKVGKIESTPLDIIVPSHNDIELISRCLRFLYLYTTSPFHLIVVDDSTDLTPLWLENEQKKHDNFTLIHHDEPYRCGNQFFEEAFCYCKHEFVATVMNSVKVEPEWESVALEFLKGEPTVGTVALKCVFPTNGLIESIGIKFTDGYFPLELGRDCVGHLFTSIYEREAVQWAFAIHRLNAVKGNLDTESYHGFLGWDDLDNCLEIRKKGWRVFYAGSGAGYHEARATRGTDDKEAIIKNHENALTFWRKWGMLAAYIKKAGTAEEKKRFKKLGQKMVQLKGENYGNEINR